jgi:hypothetical protein
MIAGLKYAKKPKMCQYAGSAATDRSRSARIGILLFDMPVGIQYIDRHDGS